MGAVSVFSSNFRQKRRQSQTVSLTCSWCRNRGKQDEIARGYSESHAVLSERLRFSTTCTNNETLCFPKTLAVLGETAYFYISLLAARLSMCVSTVLLFVMSGNLIMGITGLHLTEPGSEPSPSPPQASLLPLHLLSCNGIRRRGEREGAEPREKQKT